MIQLHFGCTRVLRESKRIVSRVLKETKRIMEQNALNEKLKKSKLLSGLLENGSLGQITRYLVTGFSSAGFEFTLLYVFRGIAGLSVIAANTAALSIVFWFNFLMNRLWAFKSKMKLSKQLPMYLALFVFNIVVSDLIMYLLTDMLQIQYLLAKVFSIGAVVSWNFVLYKKVIYK